jgi:hypothetical protein
LRDLKKKTLIVSKLSIKYYLFGVNEFMCKAIKAKKEANKHNNSTRGKEHEGRSNEGDTGFGLEFTLTLQMWISSKQQNFLAATLTPRVANWLPKLIGIFVFWCLGVKSGP